MILIPNIKVQMYVKITLFEKITIRMNTKFINIPTKYTGFLPYISPNFVTNEQPITMPNKKVEPTKPIYQAGAQTKSS